MSQVKQIIPAYYDGNLSTPDLPRDQYLEVAEFFMNSIQGEGAYIGHPASFLRMKGCTQNCVWCDTKEVWRTGNPYTFDELFDLIDHHKVVDSWRNGEHLILTGGSPLRQQAALVNFLNALVSRYKFRPFIQIENECTIMPIAEMSSWIDVWNNSPKLESSGNPFNIRYRPEILRRLSFLENSWFKFVVSDEKEWKEIEDLFLATKLIKKRQIILMPKGAAREELEANREVVIDMAVKNGVRYCTREHIVVWNKKTGI